MLCICLIVIDSGPRAVIVADLDGIEAALCVIIVAHVAPRLRIGLIVIDSNQRVVVVAELDVIEAARRVIAIQQVNPRLHGSRVENGDSCAARARPQRYLRITEAQLLDICDDVKTVRAILAPIGHSPICAVGPRDAV